MKNYMMSDCICIFLHLLRWVAGRPSEAEHYLKAGMWCDKTPAITIITEWAAGWICCRLLCAWHWRLVKQTMRGTTKLEPNSAPEFYVDSGSKMYKFSRHPALCLHVFIWEAALIYFQSLFFTRITSFMDVKYFEEYLTIKRFKWR